MKYYYIGIQTENGMVFVTSLNKTAKQFAYDITKKPLSFSSAKAAYETVEGMAINFVQAVTIISPVEINSHWVSTNLIKEALCEEDKFKALGLGKDDFYIVYNDIKCIDICQSKNGEDKYVGRYSFIAHNFIS